MDCFPVGWTPNFVPLIFFFTCHSCFHFMLFFLLTSDIDTLTASEQRWVSVSERAVHRNYVNIFLVPFVLFLRQLFFRYEAELGRFNVKHMYWLACRHGLHFSEPTLNNRFCLCSGSLPELCIALPRVWEAIIGWELLFPPKAFKRNNESYELGRLDFSLNKADLYPLYC